MLFARFNQYSILPCPAKHVPFLCFASHDTPVETGVRKCEAYAKGAEKFNVASKTAERLNQRVSNCAPEVSIGVLSGKQK